MTKAWRKISEESYRASYCRLIKRTFHLPNGRVADFDIKQEGPAICVLALTSDHQVILARQFRPGPEKILLELPGGGMEKNETPDEAAKRELLEETGRVGDFQFVGTSLDCA